MGDGANNQSDDLWQFLDADDNVLFEITIGPTQFDVFGDQTVDRVFTDGSGYRGDGDDLDIGFAAFSLDSADLGSADWSDVRQLSIRVPGSGNEPKTDYAFFGIDLALVSSSGAVVPEPSSSLLLILGSTIFLLRRKK